jgi:hypothetical protein
MCTLASELLWQNALSETASRKSGTQLKLEILTKLLS